MREAEVNRVHMTGGIKNTMCSKHTVPGGRQAQHVTSRQEFSHTVFCDLKAANASPFFLLTAFIISFVQCLTTERSCRKEGFFQSEITAWRSPVLFLPFFLCVFLPDHSHLLIDVHVHGVYVNVRHLCSLTHYSCGE